MNKAGSKKAICYVCKDESAEFVDQDQIQGAYKFVNCVKCGKYKISHRAKTILLGQTLSSNRIANARRWLFQNPEAMLANENINNEFVEHAKFSVAERAENLFLEIAKKSKKIGEIIDIEQVENFPWLSVSSSEDGNEVRYLIQYLINNAWLKSLAQTNIFVVITPEGYEYLDFRLRGNSDGISGFCAMWFDEGLLSRLGPRIKSAVELAGYKFIRIDRVDHNNKIDDEIIANIRRSKFVVADFTGQRGGVYFEAGFALGLGKQVIWTIKKGEFDKIHFDNRQYNFIDWSEDKLEEFQARLQNRIEATVGRGPFANA